MEIPDKTALPQHPGALERPAAKPRQFQISSGMADQIGSMSRRIKLLEDRLGNLGERVELIDKNLISYHKSLTSEIRTINSDIKDLNAKLFELNEKLDIVVRELRNMTTRDEVKALEKYITLWNPMNFITRDQIERILEDWLERKRAEKGKV